jgi:bifunctional non-homologous end joining protein LigD
MTERARDELAARLEPLARKQHPFAAAPPRADVARAQGVEPVLVGEVVYRQFTRGAGRLRHTAWRGLRADREPDEVLVPQATDRTPDPAPARSAAAPKRQVVQAGGRQITLSNLDKPLYPTGFTKAQVLDYYARIAPVLLPHLAGRSVTVIRYPDGVHGEKFFEKNVSRGTPDWMPTARLPSSGSRRSSRGGDGVIEYPLVAEIAGLMWLANLAVLELHVPQWRVAPGPTRGLPDRVVFDLDPGPGTTIVACCRVAERLREVLLADGLTPGATTSGSKGMQIYASVDVDDPSAPSAYAKALAQQLARQTPAKVTATMAKAVREGRVFIDWSQNNPAKTTISPYSLRGRDLPTVATPITWDEVAGCRRASQLVFTTADVLDRVTVHGDLFAGLEQTRAPLPLR